MNTLLMMVAASLLAMTAGYAQFQIPRFTAVRSAALLTRTILIVVGTAFGTFAAMTYTTDPVQATLVFLIGFGAVHFPAAVILFIKRERGSGKS